MFHWLDKLMLKASGHEGQPLELAAPVEIQAQEEGEDGQKRLPTFNVLAYSGGPMRLGMFMTPVIVELRGIKAARKNLPALMEHQSDRIVGQADEITIDSNGVRVQGNVTGTSGDAQMVVEHARNGFAWQASIGATIDRREFLDAGKQAQVNGQTVTGPMHIVRRATLKEVSFTAIGADSKTTANVAATQGAHAMNFDEWLKAKGFTREQLDDTQLATLKAAYEAEVQGSDQTTGSPEGGGGNGAGSGQGSQVQAGDQQTTTAGQQNQVQAGAGNGQGDGQGGQVQAGGTQASATDIQAAVNQAVQQVEARWQWRDQINRICANHPQLASQAINEGWSADKAELEVMRASRPQPPHMQAGAGNSQNNNGPDTAQVLEAALCLSGGMDQKFVSEQLGESQREPVMNAALSAQYRNASLHMAMDHVIQASGDFYTGSRKDNAFIRAAFSADQQLQASGFSTLSLSGILSNVANKALIASYEAIETVWQTICAERSHGDFKEHKRYRLDSTGAFQEVGADGELKHVALSEAEYANQLGTYGAMISLTRQMQINDDLGAFLEIPNLMGRMAAIRLEEAVFTTLLSNPSSFFSSGNNNFFDGASSALSISSLSTGKQKFRDQVDSNGKPILVSPRILLAPTTLEETADNLINETRIVDGTSTSKQPARNPHAGTLQKAISPYLNNTALTDSNGKALSGQSDTAWYLFASPAARAALAVAFLNGQRTPTIESGETDFKTLGMQWRAYHDFGVGTEDPVAAVKSKGAA